MKLDTDITRIDFERQANNVLVSYWRGKWQEGSPAFMMDYEVGARIESMLSECEKHGFTVEMKDGFRGRALRGEITRVDVLKQGDVWLIRKFPFGWTAKTRPLTVRTVDESAALSAIQWLKENNWTVFKWSDRACGWKGEPMPIHDRAAILSLRRKVDANVLTPSTNDNLRAANLAFYPI